MDRRQVIAAGISLIAGPAIANAKPSSTWFFDENIENVREESQMRTGGKLDINAAFVVSQLLCRLDFIDWRVKYYATFYV